MTPLDKAREALAAVEKLEGALRVADKALRDYACHGGETMPCRRTPEQCRNECGRDAGDALLAVEAALLTPTKEPKMDAELRERLDSILCDALVVYFNSARGKKPRDRTLLLEATVPIVADALATIIAEVEAAAVERCIAAVEGERLDDPQPGTSDEAYQQALTDAVAAIRAQKEPSA